MRHFFITVIGTVFGIFAFFVALFILAVILGGVAGIKSSMKPSANYVLTLDLRQSLLDQSYGPSIFGASQNSVVTTVRALNRAKDDNNVKGLLIRANEYGMTPATAEEIRLGILDFKSSGKFVITHSQGFEGTSVIPYMAVSASDEIWQQSTSGFSAAGLNAETGFYGGVLEKIEAKPQIEQFYEYKTAVNSYLQKGLTDAHREATTSYLTSIYDIAVDHIAEDRGLDSGAVESVLKSAPHSAEDALSAGMIDKLGYFEEIQSYVKEKAGGDTIQFKSVNHYGTKNYGTGPTIALIGGEGPVVNGKSADGANPFNNSVSMGSDTLAKAFDDATKDKNVKAIVFRVSSPGGSPSASDQIHAAAARAKEAGKPVVISMGKYAASGGYYVSTNADKIVAMPTTITGSIGVFGGKIAFEDSFAKIGYNVEGITVGGEYASAYSGDTPFTEKQAVAFHNRLADVYEDFTNRVAEGRNIPLSRVREIAKGRVWTGEQAKERGLVDELGGIMKAIDVAVELAELDTDKKFNFKKFPRPKSTQQQIEDLLGGSTQVAAELSALRKIRNMPEVKAILKARAALEPGQELLVDIPVID